jgi:hypothetical protein
MNVIHIDPALFIGDGTERNCYHYPEDENLCIKIPRCATKTKQHHHDLLLYKKLSKKDARVWDHIARYRGKVMTEQGEGLLFEKVMDYDGRISLSLLRYLYDHPEMIDDAMLAALERLEAFVKHYNIILKDPSPSNLLYKKMNDANGEFIIIDGIGKLYPDIFPINIFVKTRVEKQWNKMIARMKKESAGHPTLLAKIEDKWKTE